MLGQVSQAGPTLYNFRLWASAPIPMRPHPSRWSHPCPWRWLDGAAWRGAGGPHSTTNVYGQFVFKQPLPIIQFPPEGPGNPGEKASMVAFATLLAFSSSRNFAVSTRAVSSLLVTLLFCFSRTDRCPASNPNCAVRHDWDFMAFLKVRKTPSWARSWANFSLF